MINHFKNFTSTSFSQLMGLICQLVMIKVITSEVGLFDFGLYSLILVIPAMVLPLVFSEIISGFTRFFFEEDQHALYIHSLAFLIGGFLLILSLLYVSQNFIEQLLGYFELKVSFSVLTLAFASHFFIYINSLNSTYFKLSYQSRNIFIHSLLINLPKLTLLIWFLSKFENKMYAIFLALFLGHFIAFIFSSWLLFRNKKMNWQKSLFTKLLSYSVWMIPSSYFGTIINSSDRLLIKALSNISQVGIYALGYKVGDLIRQFFIVSFASILSPIKFNHQLNDQSYQISMNRLLSIFTILGTALALIINGLANPIILIISTPDFLSAHKVVPYILSAHLIWGINDFLNTGYLLKKKSQVTSLVLFVGAGINLTLNIILIPKWGIAGACFATAFSYFCILPISYHFSKKNHSLRLNLKPVFRYFFLFLFFITLQSAINASPLSIPVIVVSNLVLATIFSLLSFMILNKNDKKTILEFTQTIVKKLKVVITP